MTLDRFSERISSKKMSRIHVLLLSIGYLSVTNGSQIEAYGNETDDSISDMKSILLSLNDSSDYGDYMQNDPDIDLLMNRTWPLDVDIKTLIFNKSEVEMTYAPAFPLQEIERHTYENDSEWHELYENTFDQEMNENIQSTSDVIILDTTNLTVTKEMPNITMADNETNPLESNTLNDENLHQFNDIFRTTLMPTPENMLDFMHGYINSSDINDFQNFNYKSNVSKVHENGIFNVRCPIVIPDSLTHRIDIQFSVLNESMEPYELSKLFEIRLRQALQEKECQSMVPLSLIHGKKFIYSWTNVSVSSEHCDKVMPIYVQHKIFNKSALNNLFTEMFLPFFRIESVTIVKLGHCALTAQPISSGTVAVIVVLALTIFPCCFLALFKFIHYRKLQRKNKTEIALQARFPIILDSDHLPAKSYGPVSINHAFEPEIPA